MDKIFYILGFGEVYYFKRAFYGIMVVIIIIILFLFLFAIYRLIFEKINMLSTFKRYHWTDMERIRRTNYKIKLT